MEDKLEILNVAEDAVKKIKSMGYIGDVVIYQNNRLSLSQRLHKIDEVIQSKNCKMGIRVIVNNNQFACVSSNELSNVSESIDQAVAMAKLSTGDPYISLYNDFINKEHLLTSNDLMILDKTNITVDQCKKIVEDMENAALSYDNQVVNSEGSSFSHGITDVVLATTNGFIGSYSKSNFVSSISVIAGTDDKMEVGYDFSSVCNLSRMKDPVKIGKEAALRAVKRLNPGKLQTCKVPIVIENRVAGTLLKNFASAIRGDNIANEASFLNNYINKKIFSDDVFIVDDPLMLSGLSSRPFDGEGVVGNKKLVVENGILKSWILDIRSANKLKLKTTGNAVRHSNASVSPSVSNFYIQNGILSVQELISDIKSGLYITDLFGFGVNLITGDYSQGASGFFIENGKISYPVNEITIASKLQYMFSEMSIANDLVFFSSVNSPTIRIDGITIAG
ncbi:modulator of DNA gyrase family protein [Ehrlichia chaffeensis str. Liberty]|uniref:TldD/PmbA family protein n=1 Tax=Ehrlichia chaffeensis TaxID=945 RepID=UPI000444D001|nr:TldD/PmbA family protein [Ehrlichia chaffeensis]AHX05549.1 modulator of DNA gyrase family protein [Ehrlichia chaffeensis str. Jax]AHX06539.1 modulator of DNA gyrase family protein [Ehrlichia chaffeensis str. Liberty]